MEELSNDELIARYRLAPESKQSRLFVEELFRRHERLVAAWCYRFTADRSKAANLARGVFAHAYANFDSFASERNFATWLYEVVRNRWEALCAREVEPHGTATSRSRLEAESSTINEALAALNAATRREIVHRLIKETLNDTEQRVLTLTHGCRMSAVEISSVLGLACARDVEAHIETAHRKLIDAVKRWKPKA